MTCFSTPLDQAEIDFENEGGETYICGNPPYYGSRKQADEHKNDIRDLVFADSSRSGSRSTMLPVGSCAPEVPGGGRCRLRFCRYKFRLRGVAGFRSLAPYPSRGRCDRFRIRPFKWKNLAAQNAGVIVVVVGLRNRAGPKQLFLDGEQVRNVEEHLAVPDSGEGHRCRHRPEPLSALPRMLTGSMPRDGGQLILSSDEARSLASKSFEVTSFIRKYVGSEELINGRQRACLWIEDDQVLTAQNDPEIARRLAAVRTFRAESPLDCNREMADKPHRFAT